MSYNYWRYPTIFSKNTGIELKGLSEAIARCPIPLKDENIDDYYYGAMVETFEHVYSVSMYSLTIKKVIFNNPATIILWADGSKTVVMCGERDTYDPEKGMAMAIARKALGNKGNYYNTFEKWLPKESKVTHSVTVFDDDNPILEIEGDEDNV